MSLQIWLPLNGNLNNNGLANYTFTNEGSSFITVDNGGKIGKCYNFNSTSSNLGIYSSDNGFMSKYINNKSWSLCIWTQTTSSDTCALSLSYGLRLFIGNTTYVSLYNQARSVNCNSSVAANDGKWHHVVATYDITTNKINFYIDGTLTGTQNYTSGYTYASDWTNGIFVGRDPNNNTVNDHYLYRGKLNDVRIYDHALSKLEVKELSKGLVGHYPLNDRYCAKNILINTYGTFGNENWSTSNVSTSQIPSGVTGITASYYDSNSTIEYTPLNHNTTYNLDAYFKSTGSTSGTTYPSIMPYDADKKFISTYNCAEGFSSTYQTTLAQPLKKGDTVIYATNLSAWTTGDNYYYHVAIFGYKDSFGRLYPDMGYTADSPAFGTKTDKSHIDKTNNTITLNSAFTGEDRPAGTVICQATEGSTYVYPFGGLALSSLSDWTHKTATLSSEHSRLKYAKYIRWFDYYNVYIAGLTITDSNLTSNKVYDVSGYNYHGTVNGNLEITNNTAKTSLSTYFNGTDNSITIPFNDMMGSSPTDYTISVWTYKTSIGSKGYQTILGGPGGFELEARDSSGTSPLYRLHNWGGGTTPYEFNKWNHFCFVRTTSDSKLYVNGELKITGTAGTVPSGSYFIGAWNTATQQNYEGLMSDMRIYTIALSADDVKELYNTAGFVDKSGNAFAYEFKEL